MNHHLESVACGILFKGPTVQCTVQQTAAVETTKLPWTIGVPPSGKVTRQGSFVHTFDYAGRCQELMEEVAEM